MCWNLELFVRHDGVILGLVPILLPVGRPKETAHHLDIYYTGMKRSLAKSIRSATYHSVHADCGAGFD